MSRSRTESQVFNGVYRRLIYYVYTLLIQNKKYLDQRKPSNIDFYGINPFWWGIIYSIGISVVIICHRVHQSISELPYVNTIYFVHKITFTSIMIKKFSVLFNWSVSIYRIFTPMYVYFISFGISSSNYLVPIKI